MMEPKSPYFIEHSYVYQPYNPCGETELGNLESGKKDSLSMEDVTTQIMKLLVVVDSTQKKGLSAYHLLAKLQDAVSEFFVTQASPMVFSFSKRALRSAFLRGMNWGVEKKTEQVVAWKAKILNDFGKDMSPELKKEIETMECAETCAPRSDEIDKCNTHETQLVNEVENRMRAENVSPFGRYVFSGIDWSQGSHFPQSVPKEYGTPITLPDKLSGKIKCVAIDEEKRKVNGNVDAY